MSGQRELIFKHALICEVAYESLPRRDRARMHRAVADWIERTFAGRRDEVVELIAYHRAAALSPRASEELRARRVRRARRRRRGRVRASGLRAGALARPRGARVAATPLDRARALEILGHAVVRHLRRIGSLGVAARGGRHRARGDAARSRAARLDLRIRRR